MTFKRVCLIFLIACSCSSHGQTSIKTMFYNLHNYDNSLESQSRTTYLKTILEDIKPDLIMVCELKNETASNYLFTNAVLPYNANFKAADFKYSQSPATSLLQMIYYNNNKLELEANEVIPTGIRDINHYTFKIKTSEISNTPIKIEVFVTHLKASRGTINMDKRLASVSNFTRELDRLPANSNVLFAGDFNFYTSNEDGFQEIIAPTNSIQIVDPINRLCPTFPEDGKDYYVDNYNSTYFWNNSSFADVHSQSTRSSSLTDGAGGGMDDRFDFIMMSKNLKEDSNLYYKTDTYKAFGNNGNCYNSYVSNNSCNGSFSQAVRNALYFFSDHLPIVMELETPQNTLTTVNNQLSIVNSNIATNYLTLQLAKNNSNKELVVYNQLGQEFIHKKTKKDKITLKTKELPKGIYYLKTKNSKPIKFIKI